MAAWPGLVPRQYSTGGKPTLGGISKRGNAYLRQLFIQRASALDLHMKRGRSHLGEWLRQLEGRSHRNVAVVALATKMVRICWQGPDQRTGVRTVSGARRVERPRLRIARVCRCGGLTVNRRIASLTKNAVRRDRTLYEDRCAGIPSRRGVRRLRQ